MIDRRPSLTVNKRAQVETENVDIAHFEGSVKGDVEGRWGGSLTAHLDAFR